MRIEGKVVLITGASGGIGEACARVFTRRGARLSLLARTRDKLERVGGPDAVITAGDVTLQEVQRQAVDATIQRFGAIDILINNAGVGLNAPSWRADPECLRAMMELNFLAPVRLTQLVVPYMIQRRQGVVVNVGSIAGKVTLPWMTLYSASKFAVGSWTDGLRMELKSLGIHAMTVCPGYVITDFHTNLLQGRVAGPIQRARMFTITAEQCAEAIARGVEAEKRTVVTPRVGWVFVALTRLLPWLMDWQFQRLYLKAERETPGQEQADS